jgi:virginiamycin B lyase
MRLQLNLLTRISLMVFLGSVCHGATITGTVKGPDGAHFKGAFVQVRNTNTKISVYVLSDKDGLYSAQDLPAGEYEVQIKAVGYTSRPRTRLSLTADQNASLDFALENGMVRWADLSYYQGIQLFPDSKGKKAFVAICFGCHGFESRMASVRRDEDGWRDRVNFMRELTRFATASSLSDENTHDIGGYINSLFGDESVLPRSPADMPGYKDLERHFSDEAMKIVYVEYEMPGPGRMPWNANPAKDGSVWIPDYGGANAIEHLDPKTGAIKEYKVPNQGPAFIHSAVATPDGTVWLAEQAPNKLGKWDPKTEAIVEYQDPYPHGNEGIRSGGSKHTVRVDSKGMVWSSGSPFTGFDPKTKEFSEYPADMKDPYTYGIDIDKDDNVWFDGFTPDGKLYKKDGKTGKITGYSPPTAGLPRRIQADSDGIIWFAEYAAGKIGRFDPKTEKFKEYNLPGPEASPYALGVDKDHFVWYGSEYMDSIGRLDPVSGQVIEYPFPHADNTMREFRLDSEGRVWFGSPANNRVGYFFLK